MSTANEWQPIDKAPKDGRWILGYYSGKIDLCDDTQSHYSVVRFIGDYKCVNDEGDWVQYPSRWMPLPPPPNDEPSLGAEYPAQDLDDRWIRLGSRAREAQE